MGFIVRFVVPDGLGEGLGVSGREEEQLGGSRLGSSRFGLVQAKRFSRAKKNLNMSVPRANIYISVRDVRERWSRPRQTS